MSFDVIPESVHGLLMQGRPISEVCCFVDDPLGDKRTVPDLFSLYLAPAQTCALSLTAMCLTSLMCMRFSLEKIPTE